MEEIIIPELHPHESQETFLIRQEIAQKLGISVYHDWFAHTLMSMEQEGMNIYVKSVFVKDWISNGFVAQIIYG